MLVSLLTRHGPVVARVLGPLNSRPGLEVQVLDIPRAWPIPYPLVGQRPGDILCWPLPTDRTWPRLGDVTQH